MKGALIALSLGIILLVLLFSDLQICRSHGTIDIHVHDTTFVTTYTFVIGFVLLFLATFFAVGGLIGTFFKSKAFWILAFVLLSIDTCYILTFYNRMNNNTSQFPKE
jgi:hypothetical protein